jgi:transposase
MHTWRRAGRSDLLLTARSVTKEVSMGRLSAEKHNELEAFWRAHIQGWSDSTLNQREYCEAHGLPLKRFGNWRAKLRGEVPPIAGKLLYRRGRGLSHMISPMTKEIPSARASYVPSGSGTGPGRRNFGEADKLRIVEEVSRPGSSVSAVARKYGIAARVLFRWRKDLAPEPQPEPVFAEVKLSDGPAVEKALPVPSSTAPVVVERSTPGIEIDLKGGRRVRFDRETDPETIQRLVSLLEGTDQ